MMNNEEKQLLLRDLCARLPYGVVVNYNDLARPLFNVNPTHHFQITLDNGLDGNHNGLVYISLDVDGIEPKPYLRPLSSMTEDEKIDYQAFFNYDGVEYPEEYIDWLNAHYFDYRGLIERGFAIEAPEGMYKI